MRGGTLGWVARPNVPSGPALTCHFVRSHPQTSLCSSSIAVAWKPKSVWLLYRAIRLLEFAQLAPTFVLLGLRGIWIFMAVQPEVEPVHRCLLRNLTLPWFFEDVRTMRKVDQFHRFLESRQTREPLPLS